MITIGYVQSATDEVITQPILEDSTRGYNALVVYTSLHFHVVSATTTRVLIRQNTNAENLIAFDGPEDEMKQLVQQAETLLAKLVAHSERNR
jgi:hypothetical protein